MKLSNFLPFSRKRPAFTVPSDQVGLAWDDDLQSFIVKESDGTESPVGGGATPASLVTALAAATDEQAADMRESLGAVNSTPALAENFARHVPGTVFSHLTQTSEIGGFPWRVNAVGGVNPPTVVDDVNGRALKGTAGNLFYLSADLGVGIPIRNFNAEFTLRDNAGGGAGTKNGLTLAMGPLQRITGSGPNGVINLLEPMLHFTLGGGGFGGTIYTGSGGTEQDTLFHDDENLMAQTAFTAVGATDVCTTASPGVQTGNQVRIVGTSISGLSQKTTYYAIRLSATTFKLATSRANALAGTAIDIGNGSAFYVTGNTLFFPTDATASLGKGMRQSVSWRFEGDVMYFTCAGKTYTFRDSWISQIALNSFYYETAGSDGYDDYFLTHNITVNEDLGSARNAIEPRAEWPAPFMKQGLVTFPALQTLNFPGTRVGLGTKLALDTEPANTRLYVGASSLNTVFGAINKFVGGAAVAEGGWISHVADANTGGQVLGRAPGVLVNTIDAAVSSNAGGVEAAKGNWAFIRQMTVGDRCRLVICGNLTGTNAKRFRMAFASPYASNVIFDSNASGTPLDAITGPYELEVWRFCTTAYTSLYFAKMILPNGTIIGPQRLRSGMNAEATVIQALLTTADAGAITLEGDDHTIHKKP